MRSLSIASHFKLSSAAVSQVTSLMRPLLSLLDLSGCKHMLRFLIASGILFAWLILVGSNWRQAWFNGLRQIILALPENPPRDSAF